MVVDYNLPAPYITIKCQYCNIGIGRAEQIAFVKTNFALLRNLPNSYARLRHADPELTTATMGCSVASITALRERVQAERNKVAAAIAACR